MTNVFNGKMFSTATRDLSHLTTTVCKVRLCVVNLIFFLSFFWEKKFKAIIAIFSIFRCHTFPRSRLLEISNIVPFCVMLVCDLVLWGEVGLKTNETLVCSPNGWCMYSLMVRLG